MMPSFNFDIWMPASDNELRNVPSHIFWKSLRNTGVNSLNVWLNSPVKASGARLHFVSGFWLAELFLTLVSLWAHQGPKRPILVDKEPLVLQLEEGLGSFRNIWTLDGGKTGSMLEVWWLKGAPEAPCCWKDDSSKSCISQCCSGQVYTSSWSQRDP